MRNARGSSRGGDRSSEHRSGGAAGRRRAAATSCATLVNYVGATVLSPASGSRNGRHKKRQTTSFATNVAASSDGGDPARVRAIRVAEPPATARRVRRCSGHRS